MEHVFRLCKLHVFVIFVRRGVFIFRIILCIQILANGKEECTPHEYVFGQLTVLPSHINQFSILITIPDTPDHTVLLNRQVNHAI